jgi:hypothetical protein
MSGVLLVRNNYGNILMEKRDGSLVDTNGHCGVRARVN